MLGKRELTPRGIAFLVIFLAALGAALVWAAPARASCGGTTVVGSPAQLETAIVDFNSQAGPCSYTIQLSSGILLSAELSTIDNPNADVDLTIDGAGFTIDGNYAVARIFEINDDTEVLLTNLTLQKAFGQNVISLGNLIVRDSAVHGAFDSGIVQYDGSLLVTGSEFSSNYTGLYSFSDTLTVINSTFANNFFLGIAVENGTTALLTNVTSTDNEKGLINWGTTTINNSVLAGNSEEDCLLEEGTVTISYSLLEDAGDNACGLAAANPDGNGNIVGEPAVLGTLGNYGGPTRTVPLLVLSGSVTAASPAIDTGSNALAVDENSVTLTTDQRGAGFPRIVNVDVNMGAFEGPLAITCPAFPATVVNEGELNNAILCYNFITAPGVYTITLGADILLNQATEIINNPTAAISLIIEGGNFAIDGQGIPGTRGIFVEAESDVTLNNLIVTRNFPDSLTVEENGGGINNRGNLTLNNVTVAANSTSNDGGGIFNEDGGVMTINNSLITENLALYPDGDGGGIVNLGTMTINDSRITDNTASGDFGAFGGGIANAGLMEIRRSTISGNTVEAEGVGAGGGIFNVTNLVIIDSTISDNHLIVDTFGAFGGGIYHETDPSSAVEAGYGAQLTIINSTISGNSATADEVAFGGGVYVEDESGGEFEPFITPIRFTNVTLSNNSATANDFVNGGGAYFYDDDPEFPTIAVTINNSILANSTTDGSPGEDCFAINTTITSNSSLYEDNGGGACDINDGDDGNLTGVDPNLGPLQNNGGPTDTHELLPLSLAIDSGNNALALDENGDPLTTDQRLAPFARVFNSTVDRGAYEVQPQPTSGFCPAESPYVGTAATTILGGGMFPNQTRTVLIKDPQQVVGLYAQLAGKKYPKSTYTSARFIPKLGATNLTTIDDNVVDSAEYRDWAVFWYATNLDAYVNKLNPAQNADRVFSRLFVTPGSATNMGRALILYPDYARPVEYFNYASIRQTDPAARLALSTKNFVYWQTAAGWFQTQTYEIELGGPLPAGWPLSVQTAVVDNDPDTRPFRVVIQLVDSNGVELARRSFQPTGPSNGQMLNINRPLFNVPAGTVKVILTLTSPRNTGDSVALVGVTANYPCAVDVR